MPIKVHLSFDLVILRDALINTSRVRHTSVILNIYGEGYAVSDERVTKHCFSTKQLSEVLLTTAKVW